MTYESQPGTIPHRVLAYMRSKPEIKRHRTAEMCEALDIDPAIFAASMAQARKGGAVTAQEPEPGEGRGFWWILGDGKGHAPEHDEDAPMQRRVSVKAGAKLEVPKCATNAFGGPLKPVATQDPPCDGGGPLSLCCTDKCAKDPEQPRTQPTDSASVAAYVKAIHRNDYSPPPTLPEPIDAWLSGRTGALVVTGLVLDDEGHATIQPKDVQMLRELLA